MTLRQEPPHAPNGATDREHGHDHEHAHDHDHVHSHVHGEPGGHADELRRASGRALWVALVVLALFFFVEIAGGILTHSLALISDAAHLLTDVAAIGLALLAQWFAKKASSSSRSFGYRRVEILAALINGFSLLLVALYIGVEAVERLAHPPAVLGLPMLIVAAVGLVAQLGVTVVLHRTQGESLNVRGAYIHAMTDAVQSVGVVIAGAIILLTGWFVIDSILSVLIGVLLLWGGGRIVWDATHVLIEGTPREISLDRIVAQIQGTPGVVRVTDLHAWSLTSGYNALSAHIEAVTSVDDAGHESLRKRLIGELSENFPIQHITLQIERECEHCRTGACGDWLRQSIESCGCEERVRGPNEKVPAGK
jgi:cobalt-zinc-cadmium efflux system protein